MTTYTKREADDILGIADFGGSLGPIRSESTLHGGNLIVVNERGVWPDANIIGLLGGERDLGWKPCWELLGTPDAPDPRDTPGLPFPFTASQLAAWMLHGLGWFAREAMGEWHDGPISRLFLHPEESKTREVVRAAYAAYRDAETVVGAIDPVHEDQAQHARESLERLEGAGATGEELSAAREAFEAARARAEVLRAGWRKRMVRQLLQAGDTVNPHRSAKGLSPKRILSPAQDQEIADKHSGGRGLTKAALAVEYGVSRRTIDAALVRAGRAVMPSKKAATGNAAGGASPQQNKDRRRPQTRMK
jgi:hypothetical protein